MPSWTLVKPASVSRPDHGEAEHVLDEISREVMQMRNLQRNQLRERHAIEKEKKARADERRALYEQRLQEAEEIRAGADEANRLHAAQVAALEKQIKSISNSKDVVVSSLHAVEEDADKLRKIGRAHV